MKCERCNKETDTFICSIFNTQMLCMECADKERKHPEYEKARAVEAKEVRKGNYNYKGIGLPTDLLPLAETNHTAIKMNYTNFVSTYFRCNSNLNIDEVNIFFCTWVIDALIKAIDTAPSSNADIEHICDLIKQHDLGNYIVKHRGYYETLNKKNIVDDLIKYLQGNGADIGLK